jgi:DNA-binding beta-propeller fold protein YncE
LIKATPSATPQGGVYTLDADFEKGMLVGVEYQTVHNQLQLSKESVTLPFIWVPNSNEGTVSKVDTRTGNELGRYRVGPAHGQPSRTTVDQQGNCWVANRQIGTVVKIGLYENGQYEDRNGNGIIETSQDKNNDGVITGDELLPFGQDECVLAEVAVIPGKEGTFPPGVFSAYANDYWNPGPRGIAVDAKGNVWIGTHDSKKFYYLDGATAQILKTNDVSSLDHTSYGAVIDANGILWSSGNHRNHVLRLDPTDDSMYVIPMGHWIYGIGIDTHGNLLLTGASENRIDLYNIATSNKVWTANAYGRGIMASDDGDVWTPSSEAGNLTRYSSNGVLKATIPVGPDPTGVSIDSAGKVWVVMNGNSFIKRIDPATSKVDLEKSIPGTVHYGYSDMTGIISRTATTRFGRWTATHNAGS